MRAWATCIGLFVVLAMADCLPAIPVVPTTPANQAQIKGCTEVANVSNALTIGGMVLSVGDGTLGMVAAALPAGAAKTDTGYLSAGIAFGIAAAAAVVGLEHSAYSSDRCVDVLGPLPGEATIVSSPDAGVIADAG